MGDEYHLGTQQDRFGLNHAISVDLDFLSARTKSLDSFLSPRWILSIATIRSYTASSGTLLSPLHKKMIKKYIIKCPCPRRVLSKQPLQKRTIVNFVSVHTPDLQIFFKINLYFFKLKLEEEKLLSALCLSYSLGLADQMQIER